MASGATPSAHAVAAAPSTFSTCGAPTRRDRNGRRVPSRSISPRIPERSVSTPRGRTAARGPRPDGDGARAEARQQPDARRVVGVHDGHRVGLPALRQVLEEEPRLGGEVLLDVAVEVEMVAGEVGEHRGVEARAGDAVLVERVRGDLDRDVRRARGPHAREEPLERDRVRRRERRGLGRAREAIRDGAYDTRAEARRAPDLLEEIRRGGLAVGSRDADHREPGGRVAREPRRGLPEQRARPAGADHDRVGDVHRVLGDDRHRAARHGLARVTAPVLARAGEREEHVAGPDPPRVDGDAPYLDVADGGGRGQRQEITQAHVESRIQGDAVPSPGTRRNASRRSADIGAPGGGACACT
jgi:hypothetical protein